MNFTPGFPSDRNLAQVIDVRQPEPLDRWCRVFGVTRHELTSVVSAVGGNPDVVRQHLHYAKRDSTRRATDQLLIA